MDVFEALADPTRRRILRALAGTPCPAGALAAAEAHSRPAVSRHLRVLREAGLVRAESVGRTRVYSLDSAALGPVRRFLDQLAPGVGDLADVGARSAALTSAPIAPEHFDALDLEVRRTSHGMSSTRREGIA